MVQLSKYVTKPFLAALVLVVLCPAFALASDAQMQQAKAQALEAGATEQDVNSLMSLCYSHSVAQEHTAGLLEAITAAAGVNMPLAPLHTKTAEGLKKRVPAPRIRTVLIRMVDEFSFTFSLASRADMGSPHPEAVYRLSQSLSAGVTRQLMATFFKNAPQASLTEMTVAMEFMASLQQSGLPTGHSRQIAETGLESGFFKNPDWGLARAVRAAKHRNLADDKTIAVGVMQAMAGQFNARQLAESWGVPAVAMSSGAHIKDGDGGGDGENNANEPSRRGFGPREEERGGGGDGGGRGRDGGVGRC